MIRITRSRDVKIYEHKQIFRRTCLHASKSGTSREVRVTKRRKSSAPETRESEAQFLSNALGISYRQLQE
jgi:hypothetical protein